MTTLSVAVITVALLHTIPAPAPAAAQAPRRPAAAPASTAGQSPANFIMWLRCSDVLSMTDGDLDRWKQRGVDGFNCNIQWAKDMGGTQDFTADPARSLDAPNFALQRRIRDSRIVERAASRDMKLYLGVYLGNYNNPSTPFAGWFDDGWERTVLPKFRDLAGAAKMLGFAGIGLDGELYPQAGGRSTATWRWSFPGNRRDEAAVRAQVRARGQQLMGAILAGYPNVSILVYDALLPETWAENVQRAVNHIADAYEPLVHLDFWDGMTSVEGYGEIDFLDAIFYKTTHVNGVSWDSALSYDLNRFYALLSRRLTNWAYASQRIGRIPFAWIDAGPRPFEVARGAAAVSDQLSAFRRWSSGSSLVNYMWGGSHNGFDYGPYTQAMTAASTRVTVDTQPPTVSIHAGQPAAQTLTGAASDDFAVRSVTWTNTATGARGAAAMQWTVVSGDGKRAPWVWRMDWTAALTGLVPGVNAITVRATDIHGLTTKSTVQVARGTGSHAPVPPVVTAPAVPKPPAAPRAPAGSGAPVVFLSELDPTSGTNGYGPFEQDRSNGGTAAGDGRPMVLNGIGHAKGLGVHSSSGISYALDGRFTTFTSEVGIDDECGAPGSVRFQVFVDGVKQAETPTLTSTSYTRTLTVDVTGGSRLRLVVTDGGDGRACDHADWAGARLLRGRPGATGSRRG